MNRITLPALEPNQADLFLNPPSEGVSEASHNAYRGDREAYLEFCGDRGLSIGDPTSLDAYKNFLLESSVKPTTINRKLCGIKPSKNEKVIRPEAVLTEEEITMLISGADPKTAMIILFLSKTGTRISEALNITLKDIKEKDGAVEIAVIGKGQKGRTVYVSKSDHSSIRQIFKWKKYLFESNSCESLR